MKELEAGDSDSRSYSEEEVCERLGVTKKFKE